jgi:hypothetical protein
MADRRNHSRAACGFRSGLRTAAFKAAIEAEPRSRFRKFIAAAAVWHYPDLMERAGDFSIRSISSIATR